MKRDYLDYIQDILDSVEDINAFTKGMDEVAFKNDRKTFKAVVKSLEIIGEAAKKIPNSVKNKYSDIPWGDIMGMRDKLVHEYFGIDEEIVWKVVANELPIIRPRIEELHKEIQAEG